MADVFLSAAVGFATGLAGAALTERLKGSVAALEAELVRLDGVQDQLASILDYPPAVERMAPLRDLSAVRRRIGINLRALIVKEVPYAKVSAELSRLDRVIGRAEDGEFLSPELQAELDGVVLRLRRNVKRSSVKSRAYAVLRG